MYHLLFVAVISGKVHRSTGPPFDDLDQAIETADRLNRTPTAGVHECYALRYFVVHESELGDFGIRYPG